MSSKDHWENVYSTKAINAVSWFQEHADRSLRMIKRISIDKSSKIIDVGGGASTLVDDLLADGYTNISVLDISAAALIAAKHRLGEANASKITWLEADITKINLPAQAFNVWHDRAVFHFLTNPDDRLAYIAKVLHAVKPGGFVIISTFAQDGPTQCSDLPIVRYSVPELQSIFGKSFSLIHSEKESHHTPFNTVQNFIYCCFQVVDRIK